MGAYLTIVGIVYALCFSLTLQLAVDRFHMLQTAVYQETRCLGSLLGLFRNLTALDPQAKIPLFEGLLAYTTALVANISRDNEVMDDAVLELYDLFGVVSMIACDGNNDTADEVLMAKCLDILDEIAQQRLARVAALRQKVQVNLWLGR